MRSLVMAAILLNSLSVATLLAKEQTRTFVVSQDVPDETVILESKSDKYGTYNIADGTQGPFWSAQGIWNSSTKAYTGLTIAAGSTRISGFSATTGLLPGMAVEITPDAMPANTTIVSVDPTSIVVSSASAKNGTGEVGIFGLVNNGVMFNQVITNYPRTFPERTKVEWSYPSQRNDAGVYSYAIIAGYGVGSGGYFNPSNRPTPKNVSQFTDLSVTYDVSVAGDSNDFDLLVELFPTTTSDPSPPNTVNTMTNEIGFLPHVPDFLWTYILTLSDHFDYTSSDGTFHAYIATRPGKAFTKVPPFTMIVPVTEARGRTPRDMIIGSQTLPVLGVLRELVARGVMPADSYVCGFDFGFEIGRNSGDAILNEITWKWQ